jgi:hypothetical protein
MHVKRANLLLGVDPAQVTNCVPSRNVRVNEHQFAADFDDGVTSHCDETAMGIVSFHAVAVKDSDGSAIAFAMTSAEARTSITLDLKDFRRWLDSLNAYCLLIELEAGPR